ncbi:hypothetical protein PoB_005921600 [Plakobranchus ocellatus]|uniref:Uncharacterized protein n=1 Tax=Plakobranchus ocellatus TaxID=259542 RepID=A0AAV4CBM7_9GAST|nr:hypothetical protein PoB_005921600 [Plakobranchus ocellatus]
MIEEVVKEKEKICTPGKRLGKDLDEEIREGMHEEKTTLRAFQKVNLTSWLHRCPLNLESLSPDRASVDLFKKRKMRRSKICRASASIHSKKILISAAACFRKCGVIVIFRHTVVPAALTIWYITEKQSKSESGVFSVCDANV